MFIVTHCSAHRLSLASCDASDASSMVPRFQQILNQIYVFFSRSFVRTAELSEMRKALNEPHLKLQQPTETRWLSHQNAVDAPRRCLNAVYTTLQQEAAERAEATAYGLCKEIEKPEFIASLLLLSNILAVLGNLSCTFQLPQFNLLVVKQLVTDTKAALNVIKENPLDGGYMTELEATMEALDIAKELDRDSFITPATPLTMLEIGESLQIDGHKLWQEYTGYKSLACHSHRV